MMYTFATKEFNIFVIVFAFLVEGVGRRGKGTYELRVQVLMVVLSRNIPLPARLREGVGK